MKDIRVIYIHHSSFSIEVDNKFMLFDYFTGDTPEIHRQKEKYIFSTHSHGDHFSKKIFTLGDENTKYILSSDISKKTVPENCKDSTVFMKPYEKIKLDDMEIRTLKSTDQGVAFLVKLKDFTIYHAGDLNNWTWPGESEKYNSDMQRDYNAELEKLSGEKIDVAFVPLDPRLDRFYSLGLKEFMEKVGATYVFPMHLWGEFDLIDKFNKDTMDKYKDKIIRINKDNEKFDLNF